MPLFHPPCTTLGRVIRTSLFTCALFSSMTSSVLGSPEATPEYTLKAAFIYNFARFTNWADRPDKLLHLCILGRDPFGSALDTIDNKEVGHFHLAVKRLRDVDEAMHTCQIVFITDSEIEGLLLQIERLRLTNGVMTVADKEGAARQGIIVELTTADRRVGFEFNQESAHQAKIEVSSKLLRLARKVY